MNSLKSNRRDSLHRAFTLIELLVVVTIIAVLVALLLVGVGGVTQKRDAMLCVSNLRQIGVAMNLYANDNDGYLPPVHDDFHPHKVWVFVLSQAGYFKGYEDQPLESPECRVNPHYGARITYGMNDSFVNFDPDRKPSELRWKRVSVDTPALTMLVSDSVCPVYSGNGYRVGTTPSYGLLPGTSDSVPSLHNGKFNSLFLDGHVSSFEAVPGPESRQENPFWNPKTGSN